MEIDARELPSGETLRADLCIIGSGPAGIAVAHALIGSGLHVVIVESGPLRKNRHAQEDPAGETVAGSPHPPTDMYRERRFGGTSTIWGGRAIPLDPIDFEPRAHVPDSGWPIRHAALARHYARAFEICEAGDGALGIEALRQQKPFIDGFAPEHFEAEIERYSPPTDFGRTYARDLRVSGRVRVLLNSVCVEFVSGPDTPAVEAARCVTPNGRTIRVGARAFVVAAGGIETVRLLGASRGRQAGGMANSSGMLGRNYMCHIEGTVGAIRVTPPSRSIDWNFGRTRDGVYARQKLHLRASRQRELGLLNMIFRLHHANPMDPAHGDAVLSIMYFAKRFVLPEYRRKLTSVELMSLSDRESQHLTRQHVGNLVRGAPGLIRFLVPFLYKRYAVYRRIPYVALSSPVGRYALDFNSEQAPNFDSRIELLDGADRYGLPRFRIDWRRSDRDVASICAAFRLLRDDLAASGTGVMEIEEEKLEEEIAACGPVGGHHIGTARMSDDPGKGVVDGTCRAHDVPNLFLAGSAVFPTCGHANPTLTIVALALRLADHLRVELGRAPVPPTTPKGLVDQKPEAR